MIDAQTMDYSEDDLVAGLPLAPLAMPKQVLEGHRSGGIWAGLLARFAALTTRSQG